LSLPRKHWKLAEPAPAAWLQQVAGGLGVPQLVAQILHNRGVNSLEDALDFLSDREIEHNPFCLLGLNDDVPFAAMR
jgi:hypothetical protein